MFDDQKTQPIQQQQQPQQFGNTKPSNNQNNDKYLALAELDSIFGPVSSTQPCQNAAPITLTANPFPTSNTSPTKPANMQPTPFAQAQFNPFLASTQDNLNRPTPNNFYAATELFNTNLFNMNTPQPHAFHSNQLQQVPFSDATALTQSQNNFFMQTPVPSSLNTNNPFIVSCNIAVKLCMHTEPTDFSFRFQVHSTATIACSKTKN